MTWAKRRRYEVKYFNSIDDMRCDCMYKTNTFNYLCALFVSYCAYYAM